MSEPPGLETILARLTFAEDMGDAPFELSADEFVVLASAVIERDARIAELTSERDALRADAQRLDYLQCEIDKAPHETVFSVYEYGTRVFALRNALDRRAALNAELAKAQK